MNALAAMIVMHALAGHASPPSTQPSGPRFSDVTASSGIDFTPTSGAHPRAQILEVKGGGIGLIIAHRAESEQELVHSLRSKSPGPWPQRMLWVAAIGPFLQPSW